MYSKLHREGEGDHPLQSDGWWNDSPSREVPIPKWQNALFTLWRVIFHPLCLRFKGSFVLDVRSIAFYRIVMGLTVIGDLIDRGRDLIFHYTDDGIMPRDLSIVWQNDQWYSVYNITGAQTGVFILFVLHGLIAFCMTIGWHSTLSAIFVCIFHNSLHSRNILVTHGGDDLIRAALFWAIFLPLGRCYSVDNLLSKKKWQRRQRGDATLLSRSNSLDDKKRAFWSRATLWANVKAFFREGLQTPTTGTPQGQYNVFSAATIAVVMQISFLYGFSAVHKTGDAWRGKGDALTLALGLDYFRMPLGDFLMWLETVWPGIHRFLTFSTLWWEAYGFLFLMSPVFSTPLRLVGSLGYIVLHIGFAVCLRLGTFFWVPFAFNAMTLPGIFWDYFVFPFLRTSERVHLRVRYHPSEYKLARFIGMLCLLRETEVKKIDHEEARRWLEAKFDETGGQDGDPTDNTHNNNNNNNDPARLEEGEITAYQLNQIRWMAKDARGTCYVGVSALIVMLSNSVMPLAWIAAFVLRKWAFLRFAVRVWPGLKEDLQLEFEEYADRTGQSHTSWLSYILFLLLVSWRQKEPTDRDNLQHRRELAHQERLRKKKNKSQRKVLHKQRFSSNSIKRVSPSLKLARLVKVGAHTGVVLFLLYLTFSYNMGNIGHKNFPLRKTFRGIMLTTGLYQNWAMFSPNPPSFNWWITIEGHLASGDVMELWGGPGGMTAWKGRPMTHDPPSPFQDAFKNHRGYKYMEAMVLHDYKDVLRHYGRYVCREWNNHHAGNADEKLDKIIIWKEHQGYDVSGGHRKNFGVSKAEILRRDC